MAEIVNLRMARKRKAQADRQRTAEQNRARHGRGKADRDAAEAVERKAAALHEAHRREPSGKREIGENED